MVIGIVYGNRDCIREQEVFMGTEIVMSMIKVEQILWIKKLKNYPAAAIHIYLQRFLIKINMNLHFNTKVHVSLGINYSLANGFKLNQWRVHKTSFIIVIASFISLTAKTWRKLVKKRSIETLFVTTQWRKINGCLSPSSDKFYKRLV